MEGGRRYLDASSQEHGGLSKGVADAHCVHWRLDAVADEVVDRKGLALVAQLVASTLQQCCQLIASIGSVPMQHHGVEH